MSEANSNNRETTSIRIDPKLWKEAKMKALEKDMSIGQYIEELIIKDVKNKK
ncbi:MAG: toxin-antitoxin system HicB family antitoxin [Candidatus Aenigmarchaeota archaeon]|nr:toxin-antitoxin system HicB family antitoxin [Candidatus Aenigmarchaeota archaeon]